MMAENHLQRHIQAYDHWKTSLINAIQSFQDWMDEQDLASNSENSLRIFETMESLRTDKLKIAFAAEFSRGKTELINAIFFADFKRRLLPSDAHQHISNLLNGSVVPFIAFKVAQIPGYK